MALSEREQKLLEQMEQALYAEDPRFATRIRSHGSGRSRRRIVAGIVAVLAGLALVLFGVLMQWVWLGGIGFALMVAGGVMAFAPARKRESGPVGSVTASGSVKGRARPAKRSGQSFMQRLEQRWERRNREQW